MRTYPTRRYRLEDEWLREEELDKWLRESQFRGLPGWTCYCIFSGVELDDKKPVDDNALFALEDCDNCDGYGIMPIPPWELE